MFWYVSSVVWLLIGTMLALVASFKMHTPDFLADIEWLTFGRARPAHLNSIVYGWASMSGAGTMLWLMARLCRRTLIWGGGVIAACLLWNVLVAIGTWQILIGNGTSIEWLEFPSWIAYPLGLLFIGAIAWTAKMLATRLEKNLYVSQWYLLGATIWFPLLYVAATILLHSPAATGVANTTANWWFAHNVLGLWLTPIGLASAYYFIPKVIGRPIHSYYLSLVGFWSLALFYNWAGTHHLIGGPIPAWVITLGTVGSMMMFVPVIAVAVNHHMTMVGHFSHLRTSPTLRFVVFGAMAYTVVSVQGSLTALRSVSETTHFTHYTIAHAHLGLYAFYTMIAFGSMYYVIPRLVDKQWASAGMIKLHFWATAIGITVYFVGLTIGGWWQGMMMNDSEIQFIEIVKRMIPFLWSRSIAGCLMTVGHVVFALLVVMMLFGARKSGTQETTQ
ncbi:MAG: cbb3-type cytochrome c oxidase subunit I [Planctomycetota bacterium]